MNWKGPHMISVVVTALALAPALVLADEPLVVTPDNYAEAEVDITNSKIVGAVGSNTFRHDRSLIPLDQQPAVTMNRDTVYSFGIFYAPKGTTITLPKSKDNRYQSAMMEQTDAYVDQVFYAPGTFEINSKTEFTGIAIRTQIDVNDPNDIEYVRELQDQIVVALPGGVKPKEYVPRDWDKKSLEALRAKYREEAKKLPNLNATSGAHGEVDPHLLRLGVSVAMGLLPPEDAVYLWRDYGLKGGECYSATYTKPGFKDKGFYSFTMYGSDRYLHDEEATLNNSTIKDDPGGTFTIYYGSESACGKVANRLGTPGDDWYLGMRIYRPVQAVIDGKYDIPVPTLVKK